MDWGRHSNAPGRPSMRFKRVQRAPVSKIPTGSIREARQLLIEFVGGEPGEQLRDQFA